MSLFFIRPLVRSYGEFVLVLYECYRSVAVTDLGILVVANQVKMNLVERNRNFVYTKSL